MGREKVLARARLVGLESMARELLDRGYGEDYIIDQVFQRAARDRGIRPKRDLSSIDDDTLARSLSDPLVMDL
jgi:hypothetical protein